MKRKDSLRFQTLNITRKIGRLTDTIIANNHLSNSYEIEELQEACNDLIELMKEAKEYTVS